MPVPAGHRGRYVYHFTHLENLKGILEHGLLSHNRQTELGLKHHSIAADSIQARRAEMVVPCGPGGVVHDYVPFYFSKRSPMLLSLVRSKNVDQMLLLHVAFPIDLVERESVVFTDVAANRKQPPQFFSDPAQLEQLDWEAIDHTKWSSRINGVDKKHERMAEVLVHREMRLEDAAYIVVWNEHWAQQVREVFSAAGLTPPRLVCMGEWIHGAWANHSFTHFREELPDDMLNKSIVGGPMWRKHCFDETVKALQPVSSGRRFSSLTALRDALRAEGLEVLEETATLIGLESANGIHQEDVGTHTLQVVEKLRQSLRFQALPAGDQVLVELAAWLHDIGKGPKSRWEKCGGKQQRDADHPIKSMEMLPRIFNEEVQVTQEDARLLCLLVGYHDLVGDIVGIGRRREQLIELAQDMREVNMLAALGAADMCAITATWELTARYQVPGLLQWAATELLA